MSRKNNLYEMKIRFSSAREFNQVNNVINEAKKKLSRQQYLKEIIMHNAGNNTKDFSVYRKEIQDLKQMIIDLKKIAFAAEGNSRTLVYVYMAKEKIDMKSLNSIDLNDKHKTLVPIEKLLADEK